MNNRNKKILLVLIVILILILPLSPVSAGTHFGENIRNISIYLKDFHKYNYPCGLFKKCPEVTPVPTSVIRPHKTIFPLTKVLKITPVSTPKIPKPIVPEPPFDIVVTGYPNLPVITPPQALVVRTTVAHNSKNTVSGKVTVTIIGVSLYETQSKKITMKHHDTTISDEDTLFTFDTTKWGVGEYTVLISFPIQPDEINIENNVFKYFVSVPYITPVKIVDFSVNNFDLSATYSIGNIISYGDSFDVHYIIENKGLDTGTGTVTIQSEGVTMFRYDYTLTPGQKIEKYIQLNSGMLPHHSWQHDYLVTLNVESKDDINLLNDNANAYIRVVDNW